MKESVLSLKEKATQLWLKLPASTKNLLWLTH